MTRRADRHVAPPTSAAGLWFTGLGGGLIGGSLAGVAEAGWVLSSTAPAEYQAVLYGALIYGAFGAALGACIGVVNAVAGRTLGLSAAMGWCLGCAGAGGGMALAIIRFLVNERWYGESGLPPAAEAGIALVVLSVLVPGVWLGRNVVSKTPLRVLALPRGTFALWAAGVALCVLVAIAPAPAAVGAEVPHHPQDGTGPRPNVVLVVVDALRYDALGVDGADVSSSPNIDRFARDAVVFEQAITAASWTRASIASLFSSVPPGSHACEGKDGTLSPENVTLAEALAGANYASAGFPNNANITAALGFGQGFDWYPYDPTYPLGAKESTYALTLYTAVRRGLAAVDSHRRVEDYYTPAGAQLARAVSWMHAQGDDRWFTFIHLMEPHDPWFTYPVTGEAFGRAENPSPSPDLAPRVKSLYAGSVREVDAQLGAFFERLRTEGWYDDALVILTSDHGEEIQDHGGWWHGATLYDEQVHVPLIVKLPHNERAGTRVPWQVREIDIGATILGVAGVEPKPEAWDGETLFTDDFDQQLVPTLPPDADPDAPLGAPSAPWSAPPWWKLPASREALSQEDFEGYVISSLRAEGRKLVVTRGAPTGSTRELGEALFDLQRDPGEQRALSEDPALEGLRLRLQAAESHAAAGRRDPSQVERPASDTDRARLRQLGYAAP